jgi:hypothetical protein
MLNCRIPTHHKEVTMAASAPLMRSPQPYFAPPVPSVMREPGTNYLSVLTSHGVVVLSNGQLENASYIEDAQQGDFITKRGQSKKGR